MALFLRQFLRVVFSGVIKFSFYCHMNALAETYTEINMNTGRKSMADSAIRVYLNSMKILAGIPLLFMVAGAHAASQFIVFSEGVDYKKEVNSLIKNGAKIEKKVPPRIVVADLLPSTNIDSFSSVFRVYSSKAQLDELAPLGPIAVASGKQWNNQVLHRSASIGTSAFGALSTQMAALSLPPPNGISTSKQGATIIASWNTSLGAGLFHVQISPDLQFSNLVVQSQTDQTNSQLPLIQNFSNKPLYIRLRSFERSTNEENSNFLYGNWSAIQSLGSFSVSLDQDLAAPQLTSPLNGYQSEGFTVILEWSGHAGDRSRVQVARDSDFRDTFIDTTLDNREFIVPSGTLEIGKTYHWRVQAWGDQTSDWSPIRTFLVNEPRNIGTDMFVNPERPR